MGHDGGMSASPNEELAEQKRAQTDRELESLRERENELQRRIDEEPHPRVKHLIIGAGMAGTLAYRRLSGGEGNPSDMNGVPEILNVSVEEDPWLVRSRVYTQKIGQPVTEWDSDGFVLQPREFTAIHHDFGRARDIALATASTAISSDMKVYYGLVTEIEFHPGTTGVWPYSPATAGCRVKVTNTQNPEPSGTYSYAATCDIAVGRGPAQRLGDQILNDANEALLRANKRLLYGEEHLLSSPTLLNRGAPEPKVLVIGGGATAAWNAEWVLLGNYNAEVIWIGRSTDFNPNDREEYRRLTGLLNRINTALANGISPGTRVILENAKRDLMAFRDARNVRNKEIFRNVRIHRRITEIERIQPDDLNHNKVSVTFREESTPQRFDQVIVSIGQNAATRGNNLVGSHFLVEKALSQKVLGKLVMIRKGGYVVGLESSRPRIHVKGENRGVLRIYGAAMSTHLSQFIDNNQGVEYSRRLYIQVKKGNVPRHSENIIGSIHQIGRDVPHIY